MCVSSFLVRMFLTNLNFTLKIRLKAHIFPRTFADCIRRRPAAAGAEQNGRGAV